MALRIELCLLLCCVSLSGVTHASSLLSRVNAGVYSSIHKSFQSSNAKLQINEQPQVQGWRALMTAQGTTNAVAPRACPFLPTTGPAPTPAELDFVELGVLFYEFGCSSNLTNNDLLFTLYGTVCPRLVARPDVPFQSIYDLTDDECFGFSLGNPKYFTGYAKVALFLVLLQFGFFFFVMVPRRHLQPIKSRDLVMTFVRVSSSLCNSIIPFGVTVYGLAFPVGFFVFAQYISAPLTTGSFTHLAVSFIYGWVLVNMPTTNIFTGALNERKVALAKLKWVISRRWFLVWMMFYYIIPMSELGHNYQLYPQNFQNNPSVFGTGRVLWWDIGDKGVLSFLESKGVNITQAFAPSVYNPNGYLPYSPHFASVVVYPSDPEMNNLSTSFLGLTCFLLFVLQIILHRMKEKLFIRGELAFINGDVISVVALIIWSGWSTNWTNDFTDGPFNWVNFFYLCNAMNIFIGSMVMPTFFTFTTTFNRSMNAGFARLLGSSKHSNEKSLTLSNNNNTNNNNNGRHVVKSKSKSKSNGFIGVAEAPQVQQNTWKTTLKNELLDYFNGCRGRVDQEKYSVVQSSNSQTTDINSKETRVIDIANETKGAPKHEKKQVKEKEEVKHLDVIVRAYKGDLSKRKRCWFIFKSWFITPKNVTRDETGRLVVLELINLEPATFLETEESGRLALDMATQMFTPEMVIGLQAIRSYDKLWEEHDIICSKTDDELRTDMIKAFQLKARECAIRIKNSHMALKTPGEGPLYGQKRVRCIELIDDTTKDLKRDLFDKLRGDGTQSVDAYDRLWKEFDIASERTGTELREDMMRSFPHKIRECAIKIKEAHMTVGSLTEITIFGANRNHCVALIEDTTKQLKRDLFHKYRYELYHLLRDVKNRMLSDNQSHVQPLARQIYEERQKVKQEKKLKEQDNQIRADMALVDHEDDNDDDGIVEKKDTGTIV